MSDVDGRMRIALSGGIPPIPEIAPSLARQKRGNISAMARFVTLLSAEQDKPNTKPLRRWPAVRVNGQR
jgi:hypothetical protein